MNESVGIIGLGYVGLPLAVAFARVLPDVRGFDIDKRRVEQLREGVDATHEVEAEDLRATRLVMSADPESLRGTTIFIVTVPTPLDQDRDPDLAALEAASRTVGRLLSPGAVVVYESTVYPGVTEEICGPILEASSGLRRGEDFTLAYSPERINPGDREHTLARVVKVVGANDPATLERVARLYETIVEAGVFRAPDIRVAESAKVLENVQRDLNIALMNEVSMIFDRLGISTRDVLAAARTKWNFLGFRPGLVGGHCIGVDPYYLTAKAESTGYHPDVILAGRRINDGMGAFVAQKLVKLLIASGFQVPQARVGVLGFTFKEDVPDLRNTGVARIMEELATFGVTPRFHDPLGDPELAMHEYGVTLGPLSELTELDALLLAVPHRAYREMDAEELFGRLNPGGVFIDVCSAIDRARIPAGITAWSL
ncbi:MAG: nucleotide sugar dehydrogenase [Deltaproteobacteria bacterium]|nr:nucleotide sugar dehydrogenase [Deltaproteobacteria bacterium]MCB9785485.1 nucleotide sugar dehydrogenase [Deltaproteobacteria bacterium]